MKKFVILILSLTIVFSLAACGRTEGQTASAGSQEDAKLTDVTVILDYVPNTNHTGMYVAVKNGYYAEEGLNVTIIEPTDLDSNTVVATGSATFGVTYQEDLTLAVASEDPLPVKAIATLIQHNTSGFVSLAGSGYTSGKDCPSSWEGITYAGWGGSGEEAVLKAVMIQNGKDPEKLNKVIADGLGYESLGRACDLMWFFEAWDCVQAEMGGVELDYIPCSELDSRLDYYTPILTASSDTIKNDPELIKAFLRATEKGYLYAIEDPEAAAKILNEYVPDYDLEMLKKSQDILAGKYMEGTENWGMMTDEVWDNYTEFLVEYGVLSNTVKASDCCTTEFLPYNNK